MYFIFSAGDSVEGPVGATICVRANTKESALKIIHEHLDSLEEHPVPSSEERAAGILEINYYLNSLQFTLDDLVDWHEEAPNER